MKRTVKQNIEMAITMIAITEEFDTRMIVNILKEEYDLEYPPMKIAKILKGMYLQRRRLTPQETENWRRKHGTKPRIVFRRHFGQDPMKQPERGARITIAPREPIGFNGMTEGNSRPFDEEECPFCPDEYECRQVGIGCIRNPNIDENTRKTRDTKIWKLEDFE